MPDQNEASRSAGRAATTATRRPIQVVRIPKDSGLLRRFWAVVRESLLHPLTTTRFVEDPAGTCR